MSFFSFLQLKNDIPLAPGISSNPKGETLQTFFEMRRTLNFDVKPIIECTRNGVILNRELSQCMKPYDDETTNRYTPSGHLIRQGPIAFIVATSKGHSSLIVSCGPNIYGIGIVMSQETPVIVKPSFFDLAAKKIANIEPPKFEFTVDVTSPDAAFDITSQQRSSKGISYAACTIKAILPFKEKNVERLLTFLNQQNADPHELSWDIECNTNSVELHTNIEYQTVNRPLTTDLRGNPHKIKQMNCANLMELMFDELSGSAYAGLACIPESITDTSGNSQDISGLWSLSQPISLSPVSSRSNSAASSPRISERGSPRSEIRGRSPRRSPRGSPRSQERRSRSRDRDSFTPEEIARRNIADARYDEHLRRGDYRGRDNGRGIIKTKKERKRKNRRTIRKRKSRRNTN
jgi:hypothetical protein